MTADIRFGAGGHKMLDRIIGAQFGKPRGILVLPRTASGDTRFGWTSPFQDPAGNPLIPGTPSTQFGGQAYNVFQRGVKDDPPPSTLKRAQDFRLFENGSLCDWRGKETEDGAGDQPQLHFHGPPTRYFPRAEPLGDGDQTFILYEPFFYDRGGTLKVDGPTPATAGVSNAVRGVAIRNVGTEDEEYVCIIGRIVSPTGGLVKEFEVHAKSRIDPDDDWRLLGSVGPYPRLGDTGSVKSFGAFRTPLFWEMPMHFNRLGTRAIAALFGLSDAPDVDDARRLFQLEIFVDGETVTDNGLVRIATPTSHPVTRVNDDTLVIETTPDDPEDLPACSGMDRGTWTVQTTTTTNQKLSDVFTQTDAPIAFDYKIDTDDEIGDITVTSIESSINETVGGGEGTLVSENACWTGSMLSADPANGDSSTTLTGRIAADHVQLWSINGGRHSASNIGPIRTDLIDNSDVTTVLVSTTQTVDGNTTGEITQTRTLATPESEATHMFRARIGGTTMIGVEWADIRYGSLILNNRLVIKQGGFNFNSDPDSGIPNIGNAISVPPVSNFPFGFGPDDVLPLGLLTTAESGFFSWAESLKFEHRFFIESEDFSRVEILEDEDFVTEGFFATGSPGSPDPFVQQIPFYSGGLFFNNPVNVPPGTNEVVEIGDPNATPRYLADTSSKFPFQNINRLRAGHDRHGTLFYSLTRNGNDGSSITTGAFSSATPNFSFTSYADYGFEDPVDRVGMPPNGTNGSSDNVDAPEFDSVICV